VKVDARVEPLVREGLAAAISQDGDRFAEAVKDIADRGDEFFQEAVALTLAICAGTLITLHNGQRPGDEQLVYLARTVTGDEEWAGLEEPKTLTFLTALADRQAVDEKMSVTDMTTLGFVVGGWLLAGFLPEGKEWEELLDEVETWLEAMPTE
jgi:hypothetical protein